MDISVVITLLGVVCAWLGFLEKRFRDMMLEVDKKLAQQEKLSDVITNGLKEDIARLEIKIDMLLNFELRRDHNNGR